VREHTSKLLSLEENLPDCWCAHADDRHHPQWVTSTGENPKYPPGIFYWKVHCLACMNADVTLQKHVLDENLKTIRALAQSNPYAAGFLKVTAVLEELFNRRDEGASIEELKQLAQKHEDTLRDFELGVILGESEDRGSS
jgi:hypothetical protein